MSELLFIRIEHPRSFSFRRKSGQAALFFGEFLVCIVLVTVPVHT